MKWKIIIILMVLSLAPTVHAWGISYITDDFTVHAGATHQVRFNLQNYVGNEPKRIVIELDGETAIASIINKKDYYLLPPKTKDHEVIVELAIPQPAKRAYQVKVHFIALPDAGLVGMANAKTISLSVEVPDGTLPDEPLEESPLDLQELYQKAEEDIKQQEPKQTKGKSTPTGLTISGQQSSSLRSLFLVVAIGVLAIMAIAILRGRKRKKNLYL